MYAYNGSDSRICWKNYEIVVFDVMMFDDMMAVWLFSCFAV